ncbi:MAG TPA: transglutaminase family protein [Ktedonobacteraceae bacterium]|nr:transglutaminase family protein [Ktedonobacteraceae bacterium]
MLDVEEIDWQRVQRTAYLIHQHFRYEYPGPVRELQQRLLIVPPAVYGDQKYLVHRLDVSAEVAETVNEVDEFGNVVIKLSNPSIDYSVDFEAWIVVERFTGGGPHLLSGDILSDARYREPSALTQPDAALREVAVMLSEGTQDQSLTLAARINDWVHDALHYEHGVTDIHTTAAQALELGRGVCQDYAHIMLALCRQCGLVARYVSGHLLGEGGTHAWVEALVAAPEHPGKAMALAFDPTHGCETGLHYITVAVGRDYYDAAPTSGTFQAPYWVSLRCARRWGQFHWSIRMLIDFHRLSYE